MLQPGSSQPGRDDEPGDATSMAGLVERARAGSRADFAEIVHRFHGRLFNFLLRRTRSTEDAEDLTQEAMVRAWQRLDRYDARWQFSTWLFTIASRLAVTHHRRRAPAPGLLGEPADRAAADPARALADREEGQDLWRIADEHLGDTARAALWLRYAEDLPPRDIARVLERSPVAVRVMLHRARAELAAHVRSAEKDTEAEPRSVPTRPAPAAAPLPVGVGEPATGGMQCPSG